MRQDGGQRRGRVHRGPLILGLAALVTALTLGCAGIAVGAVGGLTYEGCITGEEASGPTGSGACAAIPSATPNGDDSGVVFPQSVVVSADGTSLYAAAQGDDAVAQFDRDPSTGALTYERCITGQETSGPQGSGACATISSATADGQKSGLHFVRSLALSPDDKFLYAASEQDAAVAHFKRDPATGALRYRGCVTGSKQTGPTGSGACNAIPNPTSFGIHSGMGQLRSVAVSADGKSLYTASYNDGAVAGFKRNPATGALHYQGCVTGSIETGPSGSGACQAIPTAGSNGFGSGLGLLTSVATSADGKYVYTASDIDAAVARFRRNPGSGRLRYKGCITGSTEVGSFACAPIPAAGSFGDNSGLDSLSTVALSADDRSLYTASFNDDAIAHFRRNSASGRLRYKGCVTGEIQSGPTGSGACEAIPGATSHGEDSGLDVLTSLALSADGRSLYTASEDDDAIARFKRNRNTGRLTFKRCLTGEKASGPNGSGVCGRIPSTTKDGADSGLDTPSSLAVSGDGGSLYAASPSDAAIARFDRQTIP